MTAAAATIFHFGSHRRNLPQVPSTSSSNQGSSPSSSSNINNNVKSPVEKSPQNIKIQSKDGAQFQKRSKHESRKNINSNLTVYGEFFSKSLSQKKDKLVTNSGYVSYNRDANERKSSKSRDGHFYNRSTLDHRSHSPERTVEICDSLRDNLINNNTATLMTSNLEENSLIFNSGIKRNCGRILPIPSSSTRPLSIKFPSFTKKVSENKKSNLSKDASLSHSQARPLSIVLPTPRYNINHSSKFNLPSNEHAHSSLKIPSPKNRPSADSYQRLKFSTNETVNHTRKQTDFLNNNSNLSDNSYISTSAPSPSTPSYKFDCENNNVQTNRNSSFLSELKSLPMSLLENSVQKTSGFNSGHLVGGQNQQSYPSSVLCMKQNSKQINLHYPNSTKSSSTMPSTHSTATTPTSSSSSSSVVNSSPDQPSVLLVVYPVPFVNESNDVMTDQQRFNAENSEDKDSTTYKNPTKESSRCGIQ